MGRGYHAHETTAAAQDQASEISVLGSIGCSQVLPLTEEIEAENRR